MLFPHTTSRRVSLRPAGAEDAAQAYEILFRLGSPGLPLIDDFVKSFGERLSACFLVHRNDTEEVVGFSTLSTLEAAGHLRMDVSLASETAAEFATDAHALTANFAFTMWRTRKVYVHLTSPDTSGIGFGDEFGSLLRSEAVLPDHAYVHGSLRDVHVLAIHRDDWDTLGVDLLKQIV
ncbi:GNAT family N-acetyltransferase [Streptomyces sp. NPDC000229]|uniref:GNAT family N-acetyltransferase n=1 Tax=Streptomyces sp. NPDC000229 TaxID=3154247 RepID=UPI003319BE69